MIYKTYIRHIKVTYTSYLQITCHIYVINMSHTSYILIHVMYTSYMTNFVTYVITCHIRYIWLQHCMRNIIWRYITVVRRFIFEVQYNKEVPNILWNFYLLNFLTPILLGTMGAHWHYQKKKKLLNILFVALS